MNLILEDSESVTEYSYLDAVFAAAPELCELHWLITDIEASERVLGSEPVLIDGHALNEILQAKHIQFRWAVFSGFKVKPLKLPDALPYADGNEALWTGSPKPQVEDAAIEIVCWDSSATLFIQVSESLEKKLRTLYPDIKDLDEMNKK